MTVGMTYDVINAGLVEGEGAGGEAVTKSVVRFLRWV